MLSEIWTINEFLATHPLTRRRRLSATARVLQWQIVSRIRGEVIIDWISGTRFAARRGMTGITGNIYAGLHEFAPLFYIFCAPTIFLWMWARMSAVIQFWLLA